MTWNQTQNEVSRGGVAWLRVWFWPSVIRSPSSGFSHSHMRFAELDVGFRAFSDLKLCKTGEGRVLGSATLHSTLQNRGGK